MENIKILGLMRKGFLLVPFCLAILFLAGFQKVNQLDDEIPPKGKSHILAAIIPFELHNNHVYIKVSVNNSGPMWFVLDSGASSSVITLKQMKRLGLKSIRSIPMNGAGNGTAFGAIFEKADLEIMGVNGFSVPVQIAIPLDVAHLEGREIFGIVGYEFFNNFVVKLDYEKKLMTLYDKENYIYKGNGEIIPLNFTTNLPYINAAIRLNNNEEIKGDFVIDTGAAGSVTLTSSFVKENQLLNRIEPLLKVPVLGVGVLGKSDGYMGRIESIRMQNKSIKHTLVSLSQDKSGVFATSRFNNIGTEILRHFTVIFDYKRSRIILKKNGNDDGEEKYSTSGILFEGNNGKYRIVEVIENSPAAEAGLQKGDLLFSIDGMPLEKQSLVEVKEKLKAIKTIKLKIKRNEKFLDKDIKLRKLI